MKSGWSDISIVNLAGMGVEMDRKSRVSARLGATLSVCPRLFIQSLKLDFSHYAA